MNRQATEESEESAQSLSNYVNITGHFAHKADFIVKLGFVTKEGENNLGSMFFSHNGEAHLFRA
jgi:hypothetical protein